MAMTEARPGAPATALGEADEVDAEAVSLARSLVHAGEEPVAPPQQRRGKAAAIAAIVAAVPVHSLFFHRTNWLGGDHFYHQGLAYGVRLDRPIANDFFEGHLSYFSGLFHLLFGLLAQVGLSYVDAVNLLSVAGGATFGLALLALGRRIWPQDWWPVAFFVTAGLFAGPFSTDPQTLWVEGSLPSGHALWPLYPRDVALTLFLFALAAALGREDRFSRTFLPGILLGLCVATQAQIGILAMPVVAAAHVVAGPSGRSIRQRVLGVWTVAAATVVASAWWWLPHALAVVRSDGLLLENYPGRRPLVMTMATYAARFGLVGFLALPGVVLTLQRARRAKWLDPVTPFAVWMAALAPLVVVARVGGDVGLFTENRLWLLSAVPLLVCATEAVRRLVMRGDAERSLAAVILVVALFIPVFTATVRHVNPWWSGPVALNGLTFEARTWDLVWSRLRERAASKDVEVLTYEAYGATTWSLTGASVVGLWLPGFYKVGYDPVSLGVPSWEERFRLQTEAFAQGMPGVCGLARRFAVDTLLLERQGGRVATHDLWLGALYRPPRAERTVRTLGQTVRPKIVYRDRNDFDFLHFGPGAALPVTWQGNVEVLNLTIRAVDPGAHVLDLEVGGKRIPVRSREAEEVHTVTVALDGARVSSGLVLHGIGEVDVLRMTGFSQVDQLGGGGDGPFLVARQRACPDNTR